MKKLLLFCDSHTLKLGVGFLIIFTTLYPKLPSVHIIRTWVYIRLEDFFILGIAALWFIQVLRRKIHIPLGVGLPVILFWIAGLLSVIHSLIYIGPTLEGYFPHIVILNFLRRIEYMILFFIAFSTIKSVKDVRDYIIILALTTFGVLFYGLGQRFYLELWARYPAFFEKYSFCFPSFQTGNEEFAKGIPLCLEYGSRLTSTFGGHYDLAAYLVIVIPILLTVSLSVKRHRIRVLFLLLYLGNLVLLIFTASRVSFISYLVAVVSALILYKKKLFIIPVIIISFLLLVIFSESTARRLLATARMSSIVTNLQGQFIGETPAGLSPDLKKKISSNQIVVQKPPPVQNLPLGSGYIGLPQQNTPVTTNVAVMGKIMSPEEIKRLRLESGSLQLSTVSGSFIIRQALVYDISFTTRFQGEWPNAWKAFLRNPVFGSGYSTITLATDNDYFRALGETGLLGLLSFLFIFLMLGITLKEAGSSVTHPLIKAFAFGIAGGTIGLMVNASLIDVFEASKVAENLWILLGIGTGGIMLYKKKQFSYRSVLKKVFSTNIFIAIYLLTLILIIYLGSINNFFVASDFTLLRWSASASTENTRAFFMNAQNSLYTPMPGIIVFLLYSLFSFQPEGYHVFMLLMHFGMALGVYFLSAKILKKRLLAFLASLVFLLNPLNGDNIFWLSTIPITLASIFCVYSIVSFIKFRQSKSLFAYALALLSAILVFFSHPLSIILPPLLLTVDLLLFKKRNVWKRIIIYLPFIALIVIYMRVLSNSRTPLNLSPQNFLYLASVGISMATIVILDIISKLLSKKRRFSPTIILLILTMLILIGSYSIIQKQNANWNYAGSIGKNMLMDLRVGYEGFGKTTDVYFVDVPRQYNNAWVSPAGLTDSLWFIYRQNNPLVHQVSSVDEAKKKILMKQKEDNYIFIMQKDGSLKRAQ